MNRTVINFMEQKNHTPMISSKSNSSFKQQTQEVLRAGPGDRNQMLPETLRPGSSLFSDNDYHNQLYPATLGEHSMGPFNGGCQISKGIATNKSVFLTARQEYYAPDTLHGDWTIDVGYKLTFPYALEDVIFVST